MIVWKRVDRKETALQHYIVLLAQHFALPCQPCCSDTVLNPSQSEPGNAGSFTREHPAPAEDKHLHDEAPKYCMGPHSG